MSDFCIVLWTASSFDKAKKVVRLLLDEKLIACATLIDNAHSMYVWNGEIEFEKEVQVIIKSLKSKFSEIKLMIQENSSYDVPEVLLIEVKDGLDSYLSWIEDEVT